MKHITVFLLMVVLLIGVGWIGRDIFNIDSQELPSPTNRITTDVVHVYPNRVVLDVGNVRWSELSDTNSMDPVMDTGSHPLELKPLSTEEINKGDIISFSTDNGIIIHRVIETGIDETGWYAFTKGDNALFRDMDKVRFDQIEGVVVGILY